MMDFLIPTAWAQGAPAAQQSPLGFFLPMIILFVAFWFLLIRPQQKRQKQHRELVEGVSTGDEIMTAGGLVGVVRETSEQFVTVDFAPNVSLKVQRVSIAAVLPKGTVDAA
ncbi:MAG: preprotein translocase subunit YajC [Pseudomonadota bacterium]